jgi:two-component system NtrC family sensor kinase
VALRWRIRHKLMLGLGLVVGIMALLLLGTLKGLLSYRQTMKAIASKMEEADAAYNLRDTIKALTTPSRNRDDEWHELTRQMEEAKEKLQKYEEKLNETVAKGRDLDQGYKERQQVEALKKEFAKLEVGIKSAPEPYGGVNIGSESLRQRDEVALPLNALVKTSSDLLAIIYSTIGDRVNHAKRDFTVSLIFVLSTCGVGVLLLTWLLRFFYTWVFAPIRDLQEGAGRVAHGDFAQRIEVHSGDEMEDLAAAFNDMMGRLHETYTDMARQINERSRQLVRSERLAGVGFLAAGVAHEINNPLASIAFCSEALEQRLADILATERRAAGPPVLAQLQPQPGTTPENTETIAKYLKMIQQEAFRCKEITQRLLEFSRGGERRREPAELGEIVQGVLEVVQHLQSCKGKHLDFQPAGKLVAWVNAQEIKSVVLNLVANALDSMEEGGTLSITLGQKDGMAELVFTDTGCGMTAEVLENIFEPFFTRSRTGKGTGLGLSISHRIISQHGGEIEAASAGPGQGSTFTVRLPLKPAQETRPEAPADRPEEADPELYFHDRRSVERPERKAA